MNGFLKLMMALIICSAAMVVRADIYEWTDENGVKHYSNHSPPDGSTVLMKTKEEPYDEAADHARMEAERRERLELARLEIAQQEMELELREAEVERRLAEADRTAEDALREAEYYREETRYGSRIINRSGGFWCRDDYWGCNYPIYDRWYYRNEYGHSFHKRYRYKRHNKLRYLSPYQRYRYVNKHYGHNRKYGSHKYRGKTDYGRSGQYKHSRLKTGAGRIFGSARIGSNRGGYHGRGGFSRGRSSGFGRRQ